MKTLSGHRALAIVAWMFIADGVWTVLVILVSFLNGYGADSGWSIVNIWIGIGLLLRRRWALGLAPVSLFISIALGAVGLVVTAFINTEPISIIETLGYPFASILRIGTLLAVGANLAFNIWQYRVLKRTTVRALFSASDQAPENPESYAASLHRSQWWLARDLRVLVLATIVILVAVYMESRALDSKRLNVGVEECHHDFALARSALDTAEIDTRVVAPKLDLSFREPSGLTCRALRQ